MERPMNKLFRLILVFMLFIAGIGLMMPGYHLLKARLAQSLLEDAWQVSVSQNLLASNQELVAENKPWPWADTWPVAKLTILKSQNLAGSTMPNYHELESFIVLADASGESLAFGPGMMTSHVMPGDKGNSLIAAHRDTHFSILKDVSINDRMLVERQDGTVINFEVDDVRVVDSRRQKPVVNIDEYRMTLVTCFPFDMEVKNPTLRLLVSGKKVAPQNFEDHVMLEGVMQENVMLESYTF